MESIFNVRKKGEVVTPSGVKFGILSLLGSHQAKITNQDDKKRIKGFEEMLYDCIEFIGDDKSKPDLMLKYMKKLLEIDRKFLMFEIRQLSNKRNPKFVFDYEFPTEGGKKLRERKEVDFDKENFPVKPFIWVKEKMIEDWQLENNTERIPDESELSKIYESEFPVIYTSYDVMLEAQLKRKLKLPECGVEVFWDLQTAEDTTRQGKLTSSDKLTSHTQIMVHNPRYISPKVAEAGKDTKQSVPLDELDYLDIEALRKDILVVEGNVDSTIVVQYKEDSRKQQQLDLVTMPAFFFPSLAE